MATSDENLFQSFSTVAFNYFRNCCRSSFYSRDIIRSSSVGTVKSDQLKRAILSAIRARWMTESVQRADTNSFIKKRTNLPIVFLCVQREIRAIICSEGIRIRAVNNYVVCFSLDWDRIFDNLRKRWLTQRGRIYSFLQRQRRYCFYRFLKRVN